MQLRTDSPDSPLASLVDCFWYARGLDGDHAWERVLPTGAMQLVVNLRDDSVVVADDSRASSPTRLSGTVLNGVYTRPLHLDAASRAATVGVSFAPGGAAPFLDRPASELRNQTVSLEAIWGPAGRRLRDRLLDAPTPQAKFRVLETALRGQLMGADAPSFVDEAVEVVRAHSGTLSVNALVEQTGYSHRHVVDRFRTRVGLSPKRFCRVVRFQSALSRARDGPVDWPQLALACGYYDQAHLIRDFRAFADLTPTAYRGRAPAEKNHVPLAD
jgi:AraC-type DNA-binding domain-containing proteins